MGLTPRAVGEESHNMLQSRKNGEIQLECLSLKTLVSMYSVYLDVAFGIIHDLWDLSQCFEDGRLYLREGANSLEQVSHFSIFFGYSSK